MARWSDSVRLRDYDAAPDEPGIYEIGFIRSNVFNPKYIGRARGLQTTIRSRLRAHYKGIGSREVDRYLKGGVRDHLWVHWIRVRDPGFSEAFLLNRFEYDWNKRIESV